MPCCPSSWNSARPPWGSTPRSLWSWTCGRENFSRPTGKSSPACQTEGFQLEILFLEASDDVLVRRYSQTRRTHPLAEGGLVEGIQQGAGDAGPPSVHGHAGDGHLHLQRPSAPSGHPGALCTEAPGKEDGFDLSLLRVQPWNSPGGRPGDRRALSSQPVFCGRLEGAAGVRPPDSRFSHGPPGNAGLSLPLRKSAGLPPSPVRAGRQSLPDGGHRVHGRQPSLGGRCGKDEEPLPEPVSGEA